MLFWVITRGQASDNWTIEWKFRSDTTALFRDQEFFTADEGRKCVSDIENKKRITRPIR